MKSRDIIRIINGLYHVFLICKKKNKEIFKILLIYVLIFDKIDVTDTKYNCYF